MQTETFSVVVSVVSGNLPEPVKPDCSHRSTHNAKLPRDFISTKQVLQLVAGRHTGGAHKKHNTASDTRLKTLYPPHIHTVTHTANDDA